MQPLYVYYKSYFYFFKIMAVIIIVFLKYILTSVMKKINYFIHIYNITASNILFLFMAYPNCIQKITDRTFHLPVSRRSNNELCVGVVGLTPSASIFDVAPLVRVHTHIRNTLTHSHTHTTITMVTRCPGSSLAQAPHARCAR